MLSLRMVLADTGPNSPVLMISLMLLLPLQCAFEFTDEYDSTCDGDGDDDENSAHQSVGSSGITMTSLLASRT